MQSPATELNHKYIHGIGLICRNGLIHTHVTYQIKIAQPQQQNGDISDRGKLSQDLEKTSLQPGIVACVP